MSETVRCYWLKYFLPHVLASLCNFEEMWFYWHKGKQQQNYEENLMGLRVNLVFLKSVFSVSLSQSEFHGSHHPSLISPEQKFSVAEKLWHGRSQGRLIFLHQNFLVLFHVFRCWMQLQLPQWYHCLLYLWSSYLEKSWKNELFGKSWIAIPL